MDIAKIVSNLRGDGFKYNENFINFDKNEAIAKNLWPVGVDMPTAEEISAEWDRIKDGIVEDNYKTLREATYIQAGLTFDYWNELKIELDSAKISGDQEKIDLAQSKIDKFISDRDQIRLDIPNPS